MQMLSKDGKGVYLEVRWVVRLGLGGLVYGEEYMEWRCHCFYLEVSWEVRLSLGQWINGEGNFEWEMDNMKRMSWVLPGSGLGNKAEFGWVGGWCARHTWLISDISLIRQHRFDQISSVNEISWDISCKRYQIYEILAISASSDRYIRLLEKVWHWYLTLHSLGQRGLHAHIPPEKRFHGTMCKRRRIEYQ